MIRSVGEHPIICFSCSRQIKPENAYIHGQRCSDAWRLYEETREENQEGTSQDRNQEIRSRMGQQTGLKATEPLSRVQASVKAILRKLKGTHNED